MNMLVLNHPFCIFLEFFPHFDRFDRYSDIASALWPIDMFRDHIPNPQFLFISYAIYLGKL